MYRVENNEAGAIYCNILSSIRVFITRRQLLRAGMMFSLSFILLLGSLITGVSQQAAPGSAQQPKQSTKPTEQMVAMRDGIKLATSIFLPQGKGPWPTVLVRTPYGKELQST